MSPVLTAETSCASLAPVERAVLLTLVYSDLFDYPLTVDEARRYLPVACGDADFEDAVEALDRSHVSRRDGFLCLRGREEIVETRRRRSALARRRWQAAHRFASWLGRVPFLRMVAVCGSQAVENGNDDADVDLFLITEPGRLWLVQSITMVLRRLAQRRFGVEICPNFLMTLDRLEVDPQNLYVAREIAQAVPLWGGEPYARFLDANRWISAFLPRLDLGDRRHRLRATRRPWATRLAEKALGGLPGHLLDRAIHRTLLVYYRFRLRRRGWRKEDIEGAYRPDRQGLITGGYAGAVGQRFLERAQETLNAAGDEVSTEELGRFFLGAASNGQAAALAPDPHFGEIFTTRYGEGR